MLHIDINLKILFSFLLFNISIKKNFTWKSNFIYDTTWPLILSFRPWTREASNGMETSWELKTQNWKHRCWCIVNRYIQHSLNSVHPKRIWGHASKPILNIGVETNNNTLNYDSPNRKTVVPAVKLQMLLIW